MKEYIVEEKRVQIMRYRIKAVSYDSASRLSGEVLTEEEVDNYGYELIDCHEAKEGEE